MKIPLLILSVLYFQISISQQIKTIPKLDNFWQNDTCDIRCFINVEQEKYQVEILKYRYNFMCSFSFNIDISGNVVNIKGSETTPLFFYNFISKILKSTNGKWKSSMLNGKKTLSKLFVLPIIYFDNLLGLSEADRENLGRGLWINTSGRMFSFDTTLKRYDSIPKIKYNLNVAKPWLSNEMPIDCYLLKPVFICPDCD